jgi:Creatinase/Prolidase N-terminal domain
MANLDWHAERSDLSGIALLDRAPESEGIDLKAVRLYRQHRVREQMAIYGVDALILSDPVNIRYATGTRNMQVFSQRNALSRYLLLTPDRSILFEFTGCLHLAHGYETVDEVRPAKTASFVAAGQNVEEREREWAAEMAATVVGLTGKGATVGPRTPQRRRGGRAAGTRPADRGCPASRRDGQGDQIGGRDEMRERVASRHRDSCRKASRGHPSGTDRE